MIDYLLAPPVVILCWLGLNLYAGVTTARNGKCPDGYPFNWRLLVWAPEWIEWCWDRHLKNLHKKFWGGK